MRLSRRGARRHVVPTPGVVGHRSSAITTFASGSGVANTYTLNAPPTIFYGDLILLFVAQNNNPLANVSSAPSGFTLLRRIVDGSNCSVDIYWKFASASEPTTYSIGYDAGTKLLAHAAAYGSIDLTSPFIVEAGLAEAGTSPTAHTTASITNTAEAILVSYCADRVATSSTPTWTATDTIRQQGFDGGSSPNSGVLQDSGTTVAAGTYSRTMTSTVASGAAVMWIGALRKGSSVSGGGGGSGGSTLPLPYLTGISTASALVRSPLVNPNATFTTNYNNDIATGTTCDFRTSTFNGYFFYDATYNEGTFNPTTNPATAHQQTNRPFRVGNTSLPQNIAIIGGLVYGDQDPNLTWIDMKHGTVAQSDTDAWIAAGSPSSVDPYASAAGKNQDGDPRFYISGGYAVVDGLRVKNSHDGFGMHGNNGTDGVGTGIFRNCYFEDIHDDAIENDEFQNLYVYDCVFNNCYSGFSCRPSVSGLNSNPQSANTIYAEHVLMRLKAWPGGHKCRSDTFNHSYFYKMQPNSPALTLKNSIIVAEKFITFDTGTNMLPHRSIANGDAVDDVYENVTVIWNGSGSWPGGTWPGVTISTDMSIWTTALADWKTRHGMTDVFTADMAQMINPTPV